MHPVPSQSLYQPPQAQRCAFPRSHPMVSFRCNLTRMHACRIQECTATPATSSNHLLSFRMQPSPALFFSLRQECFFLRRSPRPGRAGKEGRHAPPHRRERGERWRGENARLSSTHTTNQDATPERDGADDRLLPALFLLIVGVVQTLEGREMKSFWVI